MKNSSGDIGQDDDCYVVDIDNAEYLDLSYSDIFKSLKGCFLETSEECLIGDVSKFMAYSDYLFVLDATIAKSLYVFNKNGKFIRKIGAVGNGPGEYSSLYDFTIDKKKNQLLLLDSNKGKIHVFDLESGDYERSIPLQGKGTSVYHIYYDYNTERCYGDIYYSNRELEGEKFLLAEFDLKTGKRKGDYLNVDKYNNGWINTGVTSDSRFCEGSNSALFVQRYANTIIRIDNEGISPYAVIQSKEIITPEEVAEIQDAFYEKGVFYFEVQNKIKKISSISNIIDNPSFIWFGFAKGMSYHFVMYDKLKGSTFDVTDSYDDLLLADETEDLPLVEVSCFDDEGVYKCVYNDFIMEILKEHAKENLLSSELNILDDLRKMNEDTNPIILFYEYKDEYKTK